MIKKTFSWLCLLGIAAFAVASSGGGGNKKSSSFTPEFKPIRVNQSSFTLKSAPEYAGSMTSLQSPNNGSTLYNTMVTYQKGNTIYIVPINYQIQSKPTLGFKSNLEVIDLKIRINK